MAKLKYDRPINITLNASGSTMVPKGEVWKVSTNAYGDGSEYHTNLYGGGYTISTPSSSRASNISGIAFKHIEE